MPIPTFSFIIVNYRSVDCLASWFESLIHTGLRPEKYEVIIANNDPDERSALMTLKQEYSFRLIDTGQNPGFGASINQVVPLVFGHYLVFCNPDTRFINGDMNALPQLFEEDPLLGAIGLQLVTAWGRPERWSVGESITLWQIIKNNLSYFSIRKPLWEHTEPTIVDWVSGAAFIIPKEIFQKLGGFDEQFFLYFEDADLCERVRQPGLHILYYPLIRLRHTGGQSMPSLREQKCSYFKSQLYYFRKHRPWWEATLLSFLRRFLLS